MRPRLLDLFCGGGGAAMGYHRAGWEVVGVDIAPQKNYPFEFHQADALEFAAAHWHTPYPELTIDATRLAPELATWNAEVKRSRDEYARHPFAQCGHGHACDRKYRRAERGRVACRS